MNRLAWVSALMILVAAPVAAAESPKVAIAIKDQKFVPSEVPIPAGVKVELLVRNEDPAPAEFESFALHREKIVVPGQQVSVFIGPLAPGRYEFFDDFHPHTRGHLVVK